MSKKHVEEYYAKMFSDYCEMKSVLEDLQSSLTEETASNYESQIIDIKNKVKLLEANYKRLSYIMFLLNMPNKKNKKNKYLKRKKKKIELIPIKDRKEFVEKENENILNDLKNLI